MSKKQFFGLCYPFTANRDEAYYSDLNYTEMEKTRSLVFHVIFTPKGQRIRDPQFGTDLIKYIFEPNEAYSWENVKSEIKLSLSVYVPSCILEDISVMKDEDNDEQILVRVDYSVKEGNSTVKDSFVTQL